MSKRESALSSIIAGCALEMAANGIQQIGISCKQTVLGMKLSKVQYQVLAVLDNEERVTRFIETYPKNIDALRDEDGVFSNSGALRNGSH